MPATKLQRQDSKIAGRSNFEMMTAPGALGAIDRQTSATCDATTIWCSACEKARPCKSSRSLTRCDSATAVKPSWASGCSATRVAANEVNDAVMIAGNFDLIDELIANDDATWVHLPNSSIRSIPGMTEVDTFLYLKLSKQTYTWETK